MAWCFSVSSHIKSPAMSGGMAILFLAKCMIIYFQDAFKLELIDVSWSLMFSLMYLIFFSGGSHAIFM